MAAVREHLIAETCDWVDGVGDHWLHWNDHWVLWIDAELDNFRAVLEWSAARGEQAAVLALAAPQWINWAYASSAEGMAWLEQAVAAPPGPTLRSARLALQARIGLAFLVRSLHGDTYRAERLLREAIGLAERMADDRSVAHGGTHLAELLLARGRMAEADAVLVTSADYYRHSAGQFNTWTLALRAWPPMADGDLATAREWLRVARGAGGGAAHVRAHLGGMEALVHAAARDADAAHAAAEECLAAGRVFPRGVLHAMALARAAETSVILGDLPRARPHLVELLALLRELGGRRWVAEALEVAAVALVPLRPDTAADCLRAARRLRARMGEENGTIAVLVPLVADAEERVGPGRDLPLPDVLAAAQAELEALVAT